MRHKKRSVRLAWNRQPNVRTPATRYIHQPCHFVHDGLESSIRASSDVLNMYRLELCIPRF